MKSGAYDLTILIPANVCQTKLLAAKYVTLSYDANGGEGTAPASEKKAVGENGNAQFTAASAELTREEYSFAGWSTTQDGAVEYKAGDTVETAEDLTLFAVWEQNPLQQFTITYDANGGKDAPAAQTVATRTGSAELTLSKSEPSRDGYVFQGWSQTKKGEAEFKAGERVVITGDVTLYAVWAKATDAPKTGDDSNIGLWLGLLTVSAIGAIGAWSTIKKRRAGN